MDDTPIAITVSNLSKTYLNGSRQIHSLKDLSFQIPAGKVCCLLGPNGSGKTTLLKVLAGLLQPNSGSATIMGMDPVLKPRETRAVVGWMPAEERSGFYGRLTGRENLRFFGALQHLTNNEMERTIGNLALQIGLVDELDQMMLKASGGAKQKVGLARALLHNPPVLLLDEPMRSLDPHTLLRFRRLLKDHLTRLENKTILLSTHLLEEAKRVADILIILKNGRILKRLESKELEEEVRFTSVEDFYLKTIDLDPDQERG